MYARILCAGALFCLGAAHAGEVDSYPVSWPPIEGVTTCCLVNFREEKGDSTLEIALIGDEKGADSFVESFRKNGAFVRTMITLGYSGALCVEWQKSIKNEIEATDPGKPVVGLVSFTCWVKEGKIRVGEDWYDLIELKECFAKERKKRSRIEGSGAPPTSPQRTPAKAGD